MKARNHQRRTHQEVPSIPLPRTNLDPATGSADPDPCSSKSQPLNKDKMPRRNLYLEPGEEGSGSVHSRPRFQLSSRGSNH